MEIIDLDFYRRFKVILPLNPENLVKKIEATPLPVSFSKKSGPKKSYVTRNRQKKNTVCPKKV